MKKVFAGVGICLLLLSLAFITPKVQASDPWSGAESFVHWCNQNPTTCQKAEGSSVYCPIEGEVVQRVFLHAGDGQTIFEFPVDGYAYHNQKSGNYNGIGAFKLEHSKHDISWVAVICGVASSPTPAPTPTVTPTPSVSPSPTPSVSPSPSPTIVPTPTPTPIPCEGEACPTPTPTPSPSPTGTPFPTPVPSDPPTPQPTAAPCTQNCGGGSSNDPAPSQAMPVLCTLPDTSKIGANFHILRNGDTAIAKWFPTDGDKASIYYKQVNSPTWQYAVADIDNNGYYVIHGLGHLDITFALEQKNGCSGGPMTNAVVDGASIHWTLFR